MNFKKINPIKLKRNAVAVAPPSKSLSHRALILASLSKGNSKIFNFLESEDTFYTKKALQSFGVKINGKKNLTVESSGKLIPSSKEINCGNSGTTLRFLVGLSALVEGKTIITGNKAMQKRPVKDLLIALNDLGVKGRALNRSGCPPVEMHGGNFFGGKTNLKGSISSQFFSSILIAAPFAEKDVIINSNGELKSKPYIDLTIAIMNDFGVKVQKKGYKKFIVKKGQKYKKRNYFVEGDYSNAAYFFALAAILKEKIKVKNLNPKSLQADKIFLNCIKRMGCEVRFGNDFIEVQGNDLKAINANLSNAPDIVQPLSIVASYAKGKTRINGVSHLRFKETDRLKALEKELIRAGIKVKTGKNFIEVIGGKHKKAAFRTYNDHRMAMSFSLIGFKEKGFSIENPSCVSKSFPDYFKEMKKISD